MVILIQPNSETWKSYFLSFIIKACTNLIKDVIIETGFYHFNIKAAINKTGILINTKPIKY